MEIIIEKVNRKGRFLARTKRKLENFSIGRALHNSFIVDDKYVCPEHAALLCEEGVVYIEDKDSVNGIKLSGKKIKGRTQLKEGEIVQLGRSFYRFLWSNFSVKPAVKISFIERFIQMFASAKSMLFWGVLCYAMLFYSEWVSTSFSKPLSEQVSSMLLVLFILMAIPLLFYIYSRVAGNDASIITLISLSCFFITVFSIIEFSALLRLGFEYFNYEQASLLYNAFSVGYTIVFLACMIYCSSGIEFKKVVKMSVIAVLLVSALIYFISKQPDDEYLLEPEYSSDLYSPSFQLKKGENLESYLQSIDALYKNFEQ